MPTIIYLMGQSSIYGKDGLQTNQGFLKIKLKINTEEQRIYTAEICHVDLYSM